jgi:hypothetical protein
MSERERGGGQGRRLRRRLLGQPGRGAGRDLANSPSAGAASRRGGRDLGERLSDRSSLLAVVGLVVEDLRRPNGLLRSGLHWVTDRLEQGRLQRAPYRSLPGSVIDVAPVEAQKAITSGPEEDRPTGREDRPTVGGDRSMTPSGEQAEGNALWSQDQGPSTSSEATGSPPADNHTQGVSADNPSRGTN